MIVLDVSVLLSHIRSDAIKALAVASTSRSDALSVPTTGEAGFKTVCSDNWYGLIAPAGLRAEVEAKLRKAAIKTLRSAELKKQFETQDALPSPSTPEEFTAFVKGERAKWEPVPSVSSSTEVSGGLFQGGGAGMRITSEASPNQQEIERRREIVQQFFNDFWVSAEDKPGTFAERLNRAEGRINERLAARGETWQLDAASRKQ